MPKKPEKSSKNGKPAKAKPVVSTRQVVYPKLETKCCVGEAALTASQAKDLLGWEVIPAGAGKEALSLLTDEEGNKVRCLDNEKNRPFNDQHCRTLAQDILNRRWRLNGETIIIGKTKLTLSGQHRLIGLVLAEQMWRASHHWQEIWPSEPVLETIIVFGIDETDETVRTLDNVRPRSGADVLYSSKYFAAYVPKDRKLVCRAANYAIAKLWERTGAGVQTANNFTPRRTNSELEDYIDRHPRIVECLKHIYEEDKGGHISKWVSPGYASAYLYFMGSSTSDGNAYRNTDIPGEQKLSWDLWDRACEFWVLLAQEGSDLKAVRQVIGGFKDHISGNHGPLPEREAVLAKAWGVFAAGNIPTEEDLRLRYLKETAKGHKKLVIGHRWEIAKDLDPETFLTLADHTIFGGIDLGNPKDDDKASKEDDTPEAIQERKAELRKAKNEEHKRKLMELRKEQQEAGKQLSLEDEIELLREQWPDYLLLFKGPTKLKAWGNDAADLSKISRTPIISSTGLPCCEVAADKLEVTVTKLTAAGYRVALCEQVGGATKVSPTNEVPLETAEEEIDAADPSPEEQEAAGEEEETQEEQEPEPPRPAKTPPKVKPAAKAKPKAKAKAK